MPSGGADRQPQEGEEARSSFGWVFFTGLCMGAADVVPGVSGGTMAFIMGIYERLIEAIKSVDLELARLAARFEWKKAIAHVDGYFLAALATGILAAVLVLSGRVEWALEHQRTLLFAFFFGLVCASVVSLAAKIPWTGPALAWFLLGAVLAWVVVGLLVRPTPATPWMAFVAGAIGVTAMILPGISGSFILLILGQYAPVIAAINDLKAADLNALRTLVPLGLGMVVGLMLFSRALSWLLERYYQATVALMTGFIAGSLRKIWPFKGDVLQTIQKRDELVEVHANALPELSSPEFLMALGLALLGFVFITAVDHMHARNNPIALALLAFAGRDRAAGRRSDRA